MPREQRRLAAIVSADVAGYSRLMGRDESGTLAALKAVRQEVVDPRIAEHSGRIVKTTGDGLLLEFASVVDAVRCVIAVQQAMAAHNEIMPADRRIEFRVGVNIGDIIVDGDDIFGDGVNVAARLQEIAPPGGVSLSGRVQEDVRGKLDITLEDAGERQLKNIAWPVRVWRILGLGKSAAAPVESAAIASATVVAGERWARPTLAVLPFDNMGGDAALESFCDGLAEDLITKLSSLRWVHVVSRKSSFAYKGRSPDVREVARDLGATYVLEGSVRQVGNRVRINAQLIKARSGNHAWARRYDRDFGDPFELQDEIVGHVMGSLNYVLFYDVVRGDDSANPPDPAVSPLRAAAWHLMQLTAEDMDLTIVCAKRALQFNPRSTAAYQYLAMGHVCRLHYGWSQDAGGDAAATLDATRRAVALSPADGFSHSIYANALATTRDRNGALASVERALSLDARSGNTLIPASVALTLIGKAREANDLIVRALDLAPTHYGRAQALAYQALNCLQLGVADDGLPHAEEAVHLKPEMVLAHVARAAVLAAVGRTDNARTALVAARERRPDLDRTLVDAMLSYSDPADTARLLEALRAAGLDDGAARPMARI